MSRRTKNEMIKMEIECEYYLLQTKNNHHAAWDMFVKDHIEAGKPLPDYVKGIKDFIKVSKQLDIKLNKDKLQQEKDKEASSIIEYILGLSLIDLKDIYKEYKNKVDETEKQILVELLLAYSHNGSLSKDDLSSRTIDLFKKYPIKYKYNINNC